MTQELKNTGHGHVTPRMDGVKARCGGPALCRVCQQELAALTQRQEAQTEREAFEERYAKYYPGTYRDAGGTYGASDVLNIAWGAWQARASLPAPQQATPEVVHPAECTPVGEPVAWRDPTNSDPAQGCTYDKAIHLKWPHIFRQPLYTHPAPVVPEDVVGLVRFMEAAFVPMTPQQEEIEQSLVLASIALSAAKAKEQGK